MIGNSPDQNRPYQGLIDELLVYNRTLSDDEIYQLYASHLSRYDIDKWAFYVNQSKNATHGLDDGMYTYQTFATDSSGGMGMTAQRSVRIDTVAPESRFVSDTLDDGAVTNIPLVSINTSITEVNLDKVVYNWNGSNFTMYNDSLLVLYNFDNVSVLGENQSHIVDMAGNIDANVSGDIWNASGKFGGCYEFSGGSEYIGFNEPLPIFGGSFTISMWIKIPSSASGRVGVLLGDYDIEDGIDVNLEVHDDGQLRFYWAGTPDLYGARDLRDDAWHHITFVRDKTDSKVYAYVDAVKDIDYSGAIDDKSAIVPHRIGRDNRTGDISFEGRIDEIRIWNRSLSDQEIYQQYLSNLRKHDMTHWYFSAEQQKDFNEGLDDGDYVYQVSAIDRAGNIGYSDLNDIAVDTTSPSISIRFPEADAQSADADLDVRYVVSDVHRDSCWYANDTMEENISLAGCGNITSMQWAQGEHNVTIWANDTAGNINQSRISFTIDSINPTWEQNATNLTSSTAMNSLVSFNLTLHDVHADAYVFSWYNSSDWINDTPVSYVDGSNVSVTKIVPISFGFLNWTWYFNDTFGNSNQTPTWSMAVDTRDCDNDGLPDKSDPLLYDESAVVTTGVENLNITVGGNSTDGTFSGVQEMRFYDSDTLLFNFTHNFSKTDFDFSDTHGLFLNIFILFKQLLF